MRALTPRELEFQKHFEAGLSTSEIAEIEGVSRTTVIMHRDNIHRKLKGFKKPNPQAMPLAKQKKYDELVRDRITAKVTGNTALYQQICKEMEAML